MSLPNDKEIRNAIRLLDSAVPVKVKVWSRKGRCPHCQRQSGGKHRKDCIWAYVLPPKHPEQSTFNAGVVRERNRIWEYISELKEIQRTSEHPSEDVDIILQEILNSL
jgi:hypothetical protein